MAQGCAILGMCGMEAVCGLCMNRYNMREYVHSINKETQLRSIKVNPTLPPMELHSGRFFFCLRQRTKWSISGAWYEIASFRHWPAHLLAYPASFWALLERPGSCCCTAMTHMRLRNHRCEHLTRAIKLECRQYAMSVAPAPLCQDLNWFCLLSLSTAAPCCALRCNVKHAFIRVGNLGICIREQKLRRLG